MKCPTTKTASTKPVWTTPLLRFDGAFSALIQVYGVRQAKWIVRRRLSVLCAVEKSISANASKANENRPGPGRVAKRLRPAKN